MAVTNRYKGDCRCGQHPAVGTDDDRRLRVVNDASAMSDRSGFEMQAGASVTIYYKVISSNTPPNKVWIQVYRDNDGTLVRSFLAAGAEPADGTAYTFFATSDGTSGGAPRAGVYRLYLATVKDNGSGGVGNYSVDSDGALTPATGFTGFADAGCLRGNAVCTALTSNASSYGYSASANMTLTATVTQGNGAAANQWRIDLLKSDDTQMLAGSNQAASSTAPAQSFTIGNNVQIGANNDGMRLLPIGNAAFVPTSGAILWTVPVASGVTQDGNNVKRSAFMAVDPRITFSQLLQLNDAAFGTPPSSKNVASGQRQQTDLAFLAARAVDSLGNGINSLAWTEKLWDTANLISSEASPWKSRSSTGSTKGGENGWSDAFMTWDAGLPGGAWSQKEVITTSNATGLELSNTRSLTLLAKNPNFSVITDGGNNNGLAGALDHWRPGQPLIIGAALLDGVLKKYVSIDSSPAPTIVIGQFNLVDGRGYYLRSSDLAFQLLNGATADAFAMAVSPTDSGVWLFALTGAQTAGFLPYNLQYEVILYNGGTPYVQRGTIIALGSAHQHGTEGLEWAGVPP